MWNLQLMIDGRNLQGGLSAEPPHAEVKDYQKYVDMHKMYFHLCQGNTYKNITMNEVINKAGINEKQKLAIDEITNGKVQSTSYKIILE